MKKLALLFLLAVLGPSVGLAWLAVRSLADQQFILERQGTLLYQGATDALAERLRGVMAGLPGALGERAETVLAEAPAAGAVGGGRFDEKLRAAWPLAAVGFVVAADGRLLAPAADGDARAREFRRENERFLSNRETAEVYQLTPANQALASQTSPREEEIRRREPKFDASSSRRDLARQAPAASSAPAPAPAAKPVAKDADAAAPTQAAESRGRKEPSKTLADEPADPKRKREAGASAQEPAPVFLRNVRPQKIPAQDAAGSAAATLPADPAPARQLSQSVPEAAEFRQLVAADPAREGGVVARFLQNRLAVLVWHRPARDRALVVGAQLDLARLAPELGRALDAGLEEALRADLCVALLDDAGRPVARTVPGFQPPDWKRPFVATELGEALPHWELAAYLREPEKLDRAARDLRRTLGALVGLLLLAIGTGGALIGLDLRRQLRLARQKTDFVSNVSHELKTPLTSIRMFSELLANPPAAAPPLEEPKRGQYLRIIAAEAARLTRLIDNVLDFARLERGEKHLTMLPCDLGEIAAGVAESVRPSLEAGGRALHFQPAAGPAPVRGDRDALAQIALNLLSNAEKYGGALGGGGSGNEPIVLAVSVEHGRGPGGGRATLAVLDRGPGVPAGREGKIFGQFYRAEDSLASGIPGSGLGLTLARRLAREHGGEVRYRPREGGGSRFTLELPLAENGGLSPADSAGFHGS